MRGLIAKDIRLLKSQRKFLLVMLVIYTMFLVTSKNYGGVVAYATFMASMLGLSTISYDEYDNGMSFLFALPVTRKLYVKEKFVFSFMMMTAGWLAASILTTILMSTGNMQVPMKQWSIEPVIYFMLGVILLTVLLPVQLKFSPEKRQLAYTGIVMCVLVVALLLSRIAERVDIDFDGVMRRLAATPPAAMAGVLAAVCLIAVAISFRISARILEKKEY